MPSVQSFTMTYDSPNEDGTFSEGDSITGKVTLVLSKEITIESLFVKAKGDANVHWTKRVGERTYSYSAHRRSFKLKQFLIPQEFNGSIVPAGTHIYNFRLNIPSGSTPSSFRGSHGQIVYLLEAKMSRSWRMDRTVDKGIHFVSKSFPNLQSLMSRQIGSKNKEMGFFSKGNAKMDVIIDRTAFAPGETIAIVAKVNNSSSSDMTPKFSLIQDVVFRARGDTKHESNVILKVVDNCIKPQTQKTVNCAIKLPGNLVPSIQNCDIISVEYHLKVYLDISFASDPKVVFPVVIIPRALAPGAQHGPFPAGAVGGPSMSDFPPAPVAMDPYSAGAFGGPSTSNFPPPAAVTGPYPYGQPGAQSYSTALPAYSAQPAYVSGGYNNLAPQRVSPYGNPYSSPSSVLHPPPPSAPAFHPPPSAPTFHPPPSAPEIPSPPSPPQSNPSLSPPAYNLLPSAPAMNMNTNFLSQSDEAPPSYSLLFPSSTPENSETN